MKYHVMQDPDKPDNDSAMVVVNENGLELARMQGSMSMTTAGLLIDYLENLKKDGHNKYIQIANSNWLT